MTRPYWMPSGRLSERGVPSSLLEGRSRGTKATRLAFMKKYAQAKQEREDHQSNLIRLGVKRKLTRGQKVCGARYVG